MPVYITTVISQRSRFGYRGAAEQASLFAGLEKRPRFVRPSGALRAPQSAGGILSEHLARDRFVQAGAKQHEDALAGFRRDALTARLERARDRSPLVLRT